MRIRLKGDLHPELLVLGIKVGDEFQATKNKAGMAYFDIFHTINVACVVPPENYEIIDPENQ